MAKVHYIANMDSYPWAIKRYSDIAGVPISKVLGIIVREEKTVIDDDGTERETPVVLFKADSRLLPLSMNDLDAIRVCVNTVNACPRSWSNDDVSSHTKPRFTIDG